MKETVGYKCLLEIFSEFRELIKPTVVDGVPDFSNQAMSKQYGDLNQLQKRIRDLDITGWSVEKKIDYHVVRAEMNGVEFDHRVLKQWARDPGFYNLSDGIYPRLLVHHSRSLSDWGLYKPEAPMTQDELSGFIHRLKAVPGIFDQAKKNLTDIAADLAVIAIRVKEKDIQLLNHLRDKFSGPHPEIIPQLDKAVTATENFRDWLIQTSQGLKTPAGIGKDNYNWWMKNVHMIPYTWDQMYTMIEAEYYRSMAFLKLEEHKNRNLPDFEITNSEEENIRRQEETVLWIMDFLRKNKIITVPDNLPPLPADQYPRIWGQSAYLRPDYRGYFEHTNDREPMCNVLHVIFGHYYLGGRKLWYQEGDKRAIRGQMRLFDMHEARSEALAFGIEEWMLQSGLFDNRPRSREIAYIWQAFRTARALCDLRMHSNEYSLDDGLKNFAQKLPYPWADADGDAVWWDIEETLRAPGHSSNYIVGKNMIQQLMTEQWNLLGDKFNLRNFFDTFMAGGIIPISLTRWEMTGYRDQLEKLTDKF